MKRPADIIIEKCGGPAIVAAMCKVHVSRVHRWKYDRDKGGTGGFIPTRHQQVILAAALAGGIALVPADFFACGEAA